MIMKLHNTLTNKKELFTPISNDKVTLYTCGPTVYSEPLIGNWVAYIRWDILIRTLQANGYETERVMNITDVGHLTSDADEGEDKMQKGARREGITEWEVARRYTELFLDGMEKLNLLPPEHLTKATEHIDIQIELVKTLEEKGFTYVLDDGVYFDTSKFPSYVDFAHLNPEAQQAGARVEFNSDKRNISDFVLWRLTPTGETRTMEWDSPWGRGIPGWHLECSAMAMKYLGTTLDIHTGGIDHIPVHHTNEIAQSEAATGQKFANYWLHANFLLSEGTKISKSLGNGYVLSDLEQKGFRPVVFRMFVLQSHYRTESNFTWQNIAAAKNRLQRWYDIASLRWQVSGADAGNESSGSILAAKSAALTALSDDLNTPEALVALEKAFDIIEASSLDMLHAETLRDLLNWIEATLGLDLIDMTPDISNEQKGIIRQRQQARQQKDWGTSDKLRDELSSQNIIAKDSPTGTFWSRNI